MSTGNFENWDGDMLALGPLYPFVGWEVFMVILCLIFWIGWHIIQIKSENRQLEDEVSRLRQGNNLQKAVEAERAINRL